MKIVIGMVSLFALGCASTPPIRDEKGHAVKNSVAQTEDLIIGGVKQRIWIRGHSRANPVLILLHGGPGLSETGMFRQFNGDLEKDFTIVYWDQRGAGRSYSKKLDPKEMTVDRFVADLHELVILVKSRLDVKKVVLLGHSWGSALGALYAQKHPADVSALVGVGQIANMNEGEKLSYEWVMAQAKKKRDQGAIRELEEIGPPPLSGESLLRKTKVNEKFGGVFGPGFSQGKLAWAAIKADEVGVVDLTLFGRGLKFSLRTLWPEVRTLDVTSTTAYAMPVIFILGKLDRQVPAELAAKYFEKLKAPAKELVWFENSGHYAFFEEPNKFHAVMREKVLPLVR